MKNFYKAIILFSLLMTLAPQAAAGINVLQPIDTTGVHYFPIDWENIERLLFRENGNNAVVKGLDGNETTFNMDVHYLMNGCPLPLINITTDEDLQQIPDKINYKDADIKIESFGISEDLSGRVQIRGRGNTSWAMSDKKPYRLKFEKKQSLCGLKKAKNFVLIPAWSDVSLMQNAIASFLAQLLGLPYTHEMIPVDLILNCVYRGSYLLTHKPGINAGSVDIDEDSSVMWELDTNFDEDLQFMSPHFQLPVMLSDPDMNEERFLEWKEDFCKMEKELIDGKGAEWFDMDDYARYRLVNDILKNDEIGFPKSFKMYKSEGGKYHCGPIWDFDCSMGLDFNTGESYIIKLSREKLWCNKLMKELDKTEGFEETYKKYFKLFLDNEDELWEFIDNYRETISNSAQRNYIKWGRENSKFHALDWEDSVDAMKIWLKERINFLKESIIKD